MKQGPLPLQVQDAILAVVRYGTNVDAEGQGGKLNLTEKQKALILKHYFSRYRPEDIPAWVKIKPKRNPVGKKRPPKAR